MIMAPDDAAGYGMNPYWTPGAAAARSSDASSPPDHSPSIDIVSNVCSDRNGPREDGEKTGDD